MLPAFTACTSELISRWEDSTGSGMEAQEIDVWPELQDLTGDAISRAAFGSSISEGRRIFRIQSEQTALAVHMTNLYIPGYTYVNSYYSPRTYRFPHFYVWSVSGFTRVMRHKAQYHVNMQLFLFQVIICFGRRRRSIL
jgi:hypothetical protein